MTAIPPGSPRSGGKPVAASAAAVRKVGKTGRPRPLRRDLRGGAGEVVRGRGGVVEDPDRRRRGRAGHADPHRTTPPLRQIRAADGDDPVKVIGVVVETQEL